MYVHYARVSLKSRWISASWIQDENETAYTIIHTHDHWWSQFTMAFVCDGRAFVCVYLRLRSEYLFQLIRRIELFEVCRLKHFIFKVQPNRTGVRPMMGARRRKPEKSCWIDSAQDPSSRLHSAKILEEPSMKYFWHKFVCRQTKISENFKYSFITISARFDVLPASAPTPTIYIDMMY